MDRKQFIELGALIHDANAGTLIHGDIQVHGKSSQCPDGLTGVAEDLPERIPFVTVDTTCPEYTLSLLANMGVMRGWTAIGTQRNKLTGNIALTRVSLTPVEGPDTYDLLLQDELDKESSSEFDYQDLTQ